MKDSQSIAVADYARLHNLNYDFKQREKLVLVRVADLPANAQIKIFFAPDSNLKNSIITGIRSGTADTAFPATWYQDGFPMASIANFTFFVFSLKDAQRKFIFEDIPMRFLLNVNANQHNQAVKMRTCFRFVPEDSYVTYYNVGSTKSGFYFPFIFTYHPLK